MNQIIAANWKMNKTVKEAGQFCEELLAIRESLAGAEVVLCPPFTALHAVGEALHGSGVKLGAQNLYFEKSGAFTGEVSAEMIFETGAEYVIVGHSERRTLFGEKDDLISKKLLAALGAGLKPILCIGELESEREAGETEKVLERQLLGALKELSKEQVAPLVVAYEPVWAIGTGKAATAEDADRACSFIRERFAALFGTESAAKLLIQYGGSVKPSNIAEYMALPSIQGALVGGASLEVQSFSELVWAALEVADR